MTIKAAETRLSRPMGLYDYRALIASEATCLRFLRRARWPNGIRCPRCQGRRIRRLRERGKVEYRCRRCDHHFSDISGTIFVKTRTPLSKWFLAIGLFKIGISANALMVELGVSYKVAWGMLAKLRRAFTQDPGVEQLREVDVDGAYNGGPRKGRRGRADAGKRPVLGIKGRGARVRNLARASFDQNHWAAPDFIWAMLERLIRGPLAGDQVQDQLPSGSANDGRS